MSWNPNYAGPQQPNWGMSNNAYTGYGPNYGYNQMNQYGGYTSLKAQKWGQGLGLAQAGVGLAATLYTIAQDRARFKFNKKDTKGKFNAGALVYNNTLTDRQNGLDRYNQSFGTDYGPTNQLSYMSEWGKPQNQPNQADFDRAERGPAQPVVQKDPRRYG